VQDLLGAHVQDLNCAVGGGRYDLTPVYCEVDARDLTAVQVLNLMRLLKR
jgi:hypothetical protein